MPWSPPPQTNDKPVYVTGTTQPAYWIDSATNKPYNYVTVNGTPDYSKKNFLSPAALNPNTGGDFDKSKEWGMPTGQSFLHQHAQWNSEKGEWEQPINWSNIMAAGTAGAIAAPFVMGALGGGAGAGAGGAGGAAGSAAPLASTSILPAGSMVGATVPGAASISGVTAGGALAASPVAGAGAIGSIPGAGASGAVAGGGGAAGTVGHTMANFLTPGVSDYVGMGANMVGGYLKGKADAKSMQQQREDDMRKQIANFLMNQQTMQLNATQMNPYRQAEGLNSANVRRSFAQGWSPQGGFNGQFDMSAFSPENLANENQKFQQTANNPAMNKQIMDYLSQIGRK